MPSSTPNPPSVLVLASTFYTAALEKPIAEALANRGYPHTVACVPYNQLYTFLLNPQSLLAPNTSVAVVVLLRMEDLIRLELVQRVKKVALDGYAHQEIPFEKLVEELQPERSLSYNPIFQVLFGLQNMPRQTFQASGLTIERSLLHPAMSIFDMSWFAWETDEGLLLRVEYDTDLFDDATIMRALGHYEKVLEGIAAHPDSRISELSLLGDEERRTILVEFNRTAVAFPKTDLLHDFVARQAKRTPDAPAVVFGNRRLTYRELNDRANQVAHYLIEQGAGPEVLVGIYFDRAADMLIAILGVLKSGSAYVPLDPNYPADRVRHILEDANAPIVLTQKSLADDLPSFGGLRVCLDGDWTTISKESSEEPVTEASPDNLAYVLFTSGSTGRPKGVAIEHKSVATFVHWANSVFTPQELAGVLLSTSICFDLSVFEIFVTWSAGGKIIVAENALYLPTLAAKNEVTLINTVPSAMAELVRMDAVPDSVKVVNLAGEALPEALVEQIYANTAVRKVFNLYGPTEDTTYSTFTLVPRGTAVTVGRPIANSQAYILDTRLNPVPIGVPGELYLAGEGLARGYFGRPDLTKERFISNPFSPELGSRMYRTGDLTRFLPDGNIEYLGRIDHQVKLRGFRIELGEIETVLDAHPRVRRRLVMVREDEPGNKQLVAYVVADDDSHEAGAEATDNSSTTAFVAVLRRWVAEKLPEFMVPSAFVLSEAMPLSPNGKIDRRALPAPEQARDTAAAYVAPRTPLEETLAQIWRDVLRLDKVGVQDNFFALGGHSLLATQVVSRVRQAAGVELPLRHMFEWPTIAELALRVEELKTVEAVVLPPIRRAQRDNSLPLSFAQQRLWFLNQLEPDNPLYNIPLAIRLNGALNIESLKRALNEIVQRHEVLRTRYVVENELPVQLITDEVEIALPVEDLTDLPDEAQQSAVRRMAIENGRHVFNLETGPVFRASLLKLGEQDHALLLNTHHIVSDGWSIWQFVRELAALYEAFTTDKPSPLAELRIQYADFAIWQRSWMQSDMYNKQLAYWRKQLDGATATLELPTDRVRPANPSYRGSTCRVVYPRSLTDKLNELSRREGVTLFMTLIAAYQTLLFRYSGQEDLSVGSPIANRIHAEIEDLIGFFVNTLVIRGNLSGNPTFRELSQRVRDTALGAYTNQDLPFEKLVEELQPERDLGRLPLFQVWFVLQNAPRSAFQLSGIEIAAMDVHNGTSKFDIGMFMVEKPEGLVANVEYSTEIFDDRTIQRMVGHFGVLLEAIAEDPSRRIGELPLLTAEERRQIVVEWNDTHHAFPRERSLHQFIEEQVERTPDAPALIFESQELSYRELNARANQLAHRLRGLGVGPEKLVAICAERSVEMVVGLLGVMKAGGAYVPIDPDYPRSRLAVMLADAEPPVLLTQEHLLDVLSEHSIPTICLDRDWPSVAAESTENPPVITTGKDQAYMVYTSGSTGKPKGVPNVHEGIVNRLLWMQGAYGLDGSDRVLQKTPYSFDVSVWEFFWPLMTGACLVVARPEGHKDPSYLVNLIAEQKITTLHFVPSMLRIFLETEGVERCQSLRRVICSGEALTLDLQQRFFERLGAELHNLYGPTEAAVDVSYWQCKPDSGLSIVPIGKPIWNTQLYILDQYLQPVPIGVPGELHIGGVNLARGYLKQPELTAQKFIRDPFGREPGTRLYKTGDLTRFLPDGNIEYLGRIDHQVKLRGFRIELGEIETALADHPAVDRVVVTVREDQPGDKRLVAYVVPKPGHGLDRVALRTHLEQVLPIHMVPGAFVKLDALPLTESGKINRRALPPPDWAHLEAGNRAAPKDQLELILLRIFERVLGVSNIDVDDNFFDLGGHSLLAVRLLSAVEKAVGRKIPLAILFRGSTVRSLAAILREGSEAKPEPLVVEFQAGREGSLPFFAVAAPGVRSVGYALLARNLGENQPFYKLQAAGPLIHGRPPNLTESRELAQQYVAGMRAVQPHGPYLIAAMCGGCQIAEQMILQLEAVGQRVALFAIFDTWVLEHAHRRWGWLVFSYHQRLRWLRKASLRECVVWLNRALNNRFKVMAKKTKPTQPWAEAYWPENFCAPRFHAPVVLFKNPRQPYFYIDDPLLGWGARSQGGVEVHEINANHHEVLREPHVQFVSEILLDRLHRKDAHPAETAINATATNAPAAVSSY